MSARTSSRSLVALACAAAPFVVACSTDDGVMSEEDCAAYGYESFARERAERDGDCGELPRAALAAFDSKDSGGCEGGFEKNVCSYRFAWDCPGDGGQTLTYEGIVSWNAEERAGYGGSTLVIKDRDGEVLCQSSYDEAWAGDELAPATDAAE